MPNPDNEPQLPKNQSPIIDERSGLVSRDWYRFFLNLLNKANTGGGSGTVTSVNVSGGTTGLTTSGGPVTTSGTITLAGTLDVDNGGTGATTASGARANLSAAVLGTNNDITSMTGVTGGISSPDFIQFDTTATVTDATGRLYYDDEDQFQTLTFQMNGAAIQRIGEELYYRVKLSSAANKGDVLMFTGTLGASGGLTAAPATGLLPEQANYILGLAHESGITNDWVFVTTFGEVKQINTTGGAETWVQGDILYYNPLVAGGLTKTKPAVPNAITVVAAVVHVGASNGVLFVRPTFGSVLGGTDGNVNITTPTSGNTLIYDAVAGIWENADLTAGTAISVTNGAGSITIANTGVTSAIASTGISVSSATGDVTFTNTAPDQTVVLTAGTGISTSGTYPNFTITNTAPDQTVVLTAGTGISTSGTYPNFTITNTSPSLGGDVVGPSSATDNAVARYDTTTGKLIQNSLVLIGDTGSVTGVNALTAESLTVNNDVTLGSSNTDTLEVRSRITTDLEPNANNARDIGTSGRNWRDGFFGRNLSTVNLEVTGTTSFDGQQGTSGQVLTSAGTGVTPTWTTPTTGTVTSVSGTGTVNGISLSGTVTSSGNLTLGGALTGVDLTSQVTGTLPIANGGTGQTTASAAFNALSPVTSTGDLIIGNGTNSSTRLPIGATNYVLTSNGTTATWALATGSGATISNDTSTSTNLYPTFVAATSGALANIYTSDPKYLYKPSTGELTSEHFVAGNGIFVNSLTIDTSYTIVAGTSGMSAGPVTVASGTTVTVASGSRWVVV
jgi:hypothetical protein